MRAGHLEGLGGAWRLALDQADLGRGATHVVGEDGIEPVAVGEVGGEDGAPCRAGLDEAHREAGGAHEATPGVDQVDGTRRSGGLELLLEAVQVAGHERLEVGVGAHRVEALELAHLRRHLGRDRERGIGQVLGEDRAEAALVVPVAVGVHESHGNRLVVAVVGAIGQPAGQLVGLGLVEGAQHRAVGCDALAEDVAVAALDEGRGQDQVQVVLLEAALGAHLDDVPEAGRGDECRACARAADEGVGGERRAVDEGGEVGEVGFGFLDDLMDPVEHASFRGVVGGEHLRREHPVGVLEDDVGERPADVGSDAHEEAVDRARLVQQAQRVQ